MAGLQKRCKNGERLPPVIPANHRAAARLMPGWLQQIACAAFGSLSLCATLPAQAEHAKSGSDLQQHYDAALHFQQAGDLDSAAREYREFLAAALDELANGRSWAGEYAKAASVFDEALALTPGAPIPERDYARSALRAGDLKQAEALLRELLNRDSNDPREEAQAHQILGVTLHRMNRDQEARKELEAAVALDPSLANRFDLAAVCLDIDDEKCAVETFDQIEASAADTPALHMQIGLAYGNSDFASRAVAEFKKAIAEDPRFPEAHYCLAAALLAAGADEKTFQEAESELKEELVISPNDFLADAALGKIAVSYHRYEDAEQYLQRAIELNAKNPDAFLYLGQMDYETNRLSEAETNLRKAIQLTTDASRNRYQVQKAHFLLGRTLMQTHHEAGAHAEMQIARELGNEALNQDKSRLAGMLADSEAGRAAFDPSAAERSAAASEAVDPEAIQKERTLEEELTPPVADTYNNLGAIAASQKNYAVAIADFEQAARWNPAIDGLDLNWGRAAFMGSKFSEAIAPLSRYIYAHPGDSGVRGALAMSLFMTKDYAGCVATFKVAEDKLSSIPQMDYVYAESLVQTGQVSAGQRRLESLEASRPEIGDVHRSLGKVYASQGDLLKATREFRTAILLNANDAEAHYELGKIDVEGGDPAAAISELEAATNLTPENPWFHQELAAAYRLTSHKDEEANQLEIYERLKNPSTRAQKPAPGTVDPPNQ